MTFEISQRFFFEAAHTLRRSIGTQQSARVHGHTYYAEVAVAGERDSATGMVLDLGALREHIEGIRSALDHRFLDDIPALGPATLENLCLYILNALSAASFSPCRVSVWRDASGDRCDLRPD